MMRARGLRLSLRALGGRLGAQWERERRDTLFLMAPVLVSVLAHLPWLPWWVGTGFLVLFAWRLGLLFSGRWPVWMMLSLSRPSRERRLWIATWLLPRSRPDSRSRNSGRGARRRAKLRRAP